MEALAEKCVSHATTMPEAILGIAFIAAICFICWLWFR